MIPEFADGDVLPPGIYWANWQEIVKRFGFTQRRQRLLEGLARGLESLKLAGCQTVYLDGSFVTNKAEPNDFDACWESEGVRGRLLDPVLLTFADSRAAQKAKYFGEFFIADQEVTPDGLRFLDFFQLTRSGEAKGIIAIDLRRVHNDYK
jgi:hypothetical protein